MANYDDLIEQSAKKWDIDPALIRGVIRTESGGNPKAVSDQGAQGLMQIMPGIAKAYGVKNAFDPAANIDAGARLLSENLTRYGNVQDALRAYHGGTDKANWGAKTQAYPGKVMANLSQPQSKPKNLPGVPVGQADSDAEALFQQRFGAAPAKSSDDAEQLFASRFGGAVNAAKQPVTADAVPAGKYTREWAQKNPVEFQKALESGKISPEDFAAIRGKTSGFSQGLGEAIGGVLQRGAHTLSALGLIPESAPASIDKQLQANAKAYDSARGPEAGFDWGRAVGGSVPALAVSGGPVSGLPSLVAQGVKVGAISGLMQPVLDVPEGSTYGRETAKNVGVNALVGGAVPVAMAGAQGAGRYVGNVGRSFIEPFTEKGQEAIAGRVLSRFTGPDAAVANAASNVPGVVPRLAETTGNAGVGALERGLASANPEFNNQLAARIQANNAARVNALRDIARSPEAVQDAMNTRDAATKPLYDLAASKTASIDDAFNALMKRPSMQKAISRAQSIADEQGNTFSIGRTSRPSIAGEGVPKRQIAEVSGNDLQTLKMAMDDLLSDPASGIVGKEANAVRDTRNALVKWMEQDGKIPEFKAARETFANMSKPIEQMNVANRLLQKYSSATTDLAGNPTLQANAYNRALQDESRLLKNSGAFSGYRGLKDVFTPDQLKIIKGVGQDLSRAQVGQNAGKPVGANTFQNLSTSNLVGAAIPGRLGQFLGNASPGTLGGMAGGGLGFAVGGFPGAAAGAIMGERAGNLSNRLMATQNEAIQSKLGNMLLSGQLPAAANVGRNALLSSPKLGYVNPAVFGLTSETLVKPAKKRDNASNSRD